MAAAETAAHAADTAAPAADRAAPAADTSATAAQTSTWYLFNTMMKGHWSDSQFEILAQKWSKISPGNKVDLWVFVNHPSVHIGGVSTGLWLLVSVTCDR